MTHNESTYDADVDTHGARMRTVWATLRVCWRRPRFIRGAQRAARFDAAQVPATTMSRRANRENAVREHRLRSRLSNAVRRFERSGV
jgi:hypothetical protein